VPAGLAGLKAGHRPVDVSKGDPVRRTGRAGATMERHTGDDGAARAHGFGGTVGTEATTQCETNGTDEMSGHGDAGLARLLAQAAGEVLLGVRDGGLTGRELAAAGDAGAQAVLARLLAEWAPGDAVLSEEAADDAARLAADRVWIVDPLDGTREFSEPGRTDWAVHVALWVAGELVAGAVALPAQGVCFGTDAAPVPPARASSAKGRAAPLRLAVSRSRPPEFVTELATRLGAELVPMGSAGVKCASVWRGETDAYVHAGGQFEWDSAAPVAVARAAGLHTSRCDGSALIYNRPDPRLPDLVVCRPEAAAEILALTSALIEAVDPALRGVAAEGAR
jgi:3'(2'), 5'-bisphosphate nucleotidase